MAWTSEVLGAEALLRLSKQLQRAHDAHDVVELVAAELRVTLGYRSCWLYVLDEDDPGRARLITVSGDKDRATLEHVPFQALGDDPMVAEILRGEHAVVIDDAATDPRTDKKIVAVMGNRTIVNVPLRLVDKPLGALGTGTFDAEGPRPPTPAELNYLVALAGHVSVALARIGLIEARARAAHDKQELERRLARAQRLESIGVLAGGVAHDFNNLLAIILANAQSLSCYPDDEQRRRKGLEAIVEAAGRAAELTRQLLAVGQRQRLALEPLDPRPHLERLAQLISSLLPDHVELELELEASSETLHVDADARQLDQVIMNLVLNARDAMPRGGKLTLALAAASFDAAFVRAHPWARVGEFVRIAVTDTGTGVPAELADRIFEPFFTTKPAGQGTGLGLAVAHGIVQQHDGLLRCDSTPGVGTTFAAYLPRSTRERAPGAPPPELVERGRGQRVLVADDEPRMREILAQILGDANYRVAVFGDGAAALAAARGEAFDLLILDVIMPELNGLDVAARLRDDGSVVPILLSTAFSAEMLLPATIERLDARVLEKPYSPELLLRAVHESLEARRAR